MSGVYNDPQYQANRVIVLSRDPWCEGFPIGIHGDEKIRTTAADHRVPVSAGGTSDLRNLHGLCGSCNSRKSLGERRRSWRDR